MNRFTLAVFALCLAGCSRFQDEPAPPVSQPAKPQPSPFDQNFWDHWLDGRVEICTYRLTSKREPAAAMASTATYVDKARVMHFQLRKLYREATDALEISLSLDGSGERPAGSIVSASFSHQDLIRSWWSQMFFGASRGFLVRNRAGTPEVRQTIEYPPPGFSEDVVYLWARRVAWPRLPAGRAANNPMSVTSIARGKTLAVCEIGVRRAPDAVTATVSGCFSYQFKVHQALPNQLDAWESDDGERADLVRIERRALAPE